MREPESGDLRAQILRLRTVAGDRELEDLRPRQRRGLEQRRQSWASPSVPA